MSETSKAGGKKPAASRKKASGKEAAKKSTAGKTTAKQAGASKRPAKSTGARAAAPTRAKAAAPKPAAGKRRGGNGVSPEERWRRIAEAAYLLAEERGFQGGDPVADWLSAEAEVDASLRH
ncbi:MAG TPA: DUF2934 domain-containing protein [Gammaproteobacteria bacterium]|nr:DUF2934 domain-containing protein [Gammaproteobacteria bacterium]